MTEEERALMVGGATLLCIAAPLLWLLAFLVGVRKVRALVHGIDWSHVADPDAVMRRFGWILCGGATAFAALGGAILIDTLPHWTIGPLVCAIGVTMAIAVLSVALRGREASREHSPRRGRSR